MASVTCAAVSQTCNNPAAGAADWQEILTYHRGSELKFSTRILEDIKT